ncbi:XrtA system polysaccharide deacetylase [Bowmanella denitrificans]|uniref:XrtA system polysaccharide deacetylase n=1 Tax=Bowmanella denitrificans TaxID=366582 RepID=UPI000C9B6449|nr:XrtA system polysaccharide deacetylase [Bowmanella denitrificans]
MKDLHTCLNAMTVDVEDFFHVSAFDKIIKPADWENFNPRVDNNTRRLLDIFARHGVKSTFFVLGWVAERYPQLIKEIHAQGHEIASHGYAHRRASEQSREEFKQDVVRSKQHLEDLLGEAVIGYRAPSFSIGYSNEWAFEVLVELGFVYSSSTYPVKHDLYGTPDWPRFAYNRPENIIEIPIPTLKMFGRQVPIGGGGYFRLYPYGMTRHLVRKYLEKEKQPYSFYFHPWEIDAEQPRLTQASAKSRFRHYVNLQHTEAKLERLLQDFNWSTMKDVYGVNA